MAEPTYLDLLRDELAAYQRQRAAATEKLADQPEYLARVLAMWDRAIATKQAQIAGEEARHAASIQP